MAVAGPHPTRAHVMARMHNARDTLHAAAALDRGGSDTEGWSATDHLAHVLAWEQALVAVLTGGSTPEALGYSREEYEQMETDTLNQRLADRFRDNREAVLEKLASTRAELEHVLDSMSDAEVEARFEEVRQWEAPDEPQWSAWDWLLAYAPAHDEEHAQYIEALKE